MDFDYYIEFHVTLSSISNHSITNLRCVYLMT